MNDPALCRGCGAGISSTDDWAATGAGHVHLACAPPPAVRTWTCAKCSGTGRAYDYGLGDHVPCPYCRASGRVHG